ncbi:MAG: 24 kDa macrophage-induced major protein [Myxococcaceae bacterium]|nr:24 kDa macrophage-induced major protein [Myxococcaceae bacterium]
MDEILRIGLLHDSHGTQLDSCAPSQELPQTPRLQPVGPLDTPAASAPLLAAVAAKLGQVPKLVAMIAHSPAALHAYLGQVTALNGTLNATLREQIALATAGFNQCAPCIAIHTTEGLAQGLTQEELAANLGGCSIDPKVSVALAFTRSIIAKAGRVDDHLLTAMRKADYSEGEIVEIVAFITMNLFANYLNQLAAPSGAASV